MHTYIIKYFKQRNGRINRKQSLVDVSMFLLKITSTDGANSDDNNDEKVEYDSSIYKYLTEILMSNISPHITQK